MCFCWCVTEINYKMHGATVNICSWYIPLFNYILCINLFRDIYLCVSINRWKHNGMPQPKITFTFSTPAISYHGLWTQPGTPVCTKQSGTPVCTKQPGTPARTNPQFVWLISVNTSPSDSRVVLTCPTICSLIITFCLECIRNIVCPLYLCSLSKPPFLWCLFCWCCGVCPSLWTEHTAPKRTQKEPNRCNNNSLLIIIISSTCFGR